jgi:hypothetical protein
VVQSLLAVLLGSVASAAPLLFLFLFPTCVNQERIRPMSGSTAEQARPQTSQKRIDANRINASRSTGPRTEAGKNRSKYNNLSHGQCARTLVVLPDECPEQAARDAEDVAQALGAVGPVEECITMAYTGCLHTLERCRKAEGGALNLKINAIRDEAALGRQAGVARLAPRLVEGIDLEDTIDGLRKTSAGCSYLLEQFNGLLTYLNTFQGLEPVQRVLAIHLCGRRPCDWFRDGVVRDWTYAYVFGIYGDIGVTAEQACDLLHADRPPTMGPLEFLHHVQGLIETPVSGVAANALLRKLLAAQIKDLTDLRDLRKFQEARDLEDQVAAAHVDGTPEGRNRRHYEAAAIRNMKALRIELEALQALRRERGEEPEAPEPAENVGEGTEPNAPQAQEEAGGSPEASQPARPAVPTTPGIHTMGTWEVVCHRLE